MGWWKTQGTEQMVGDMPLDVLGRAARGVVAQYQTAFGRLPTKAEWETLLGLIFANEFSEDRYFQEGVALRVTFELKQE